jgi:phosphoribosyl 1,2-cyclic phosphodiesterase
VNERIRAHGHGNVSAAHSSTFEVTTDDYLTPAGDCIIGIGADRAPADFDPAFVEACRSHEATITATLRAAGETETITARPGQAARVSGRRVGFLETEHRDPTNVGFKIETSAGTVTYFTDTIAREDLVDQLEGTRVLLLGVTRPRGAHIPDHMSTEDAVDIAERIQPDLLAMTHLGLKLIRRGPEPEARYVEQETGVRTIAAQDLAELTIEEGVRVRDPQAPTPEAKG